MDMDGKQKEGLAKYL
ncbi:hypothetical protein EYZ11_013124 [Aspergillus tanneri]|uniref:Uncharacterized protein n=1 Tax=Aspergillus tanneri TaxID=1220188 RepID=A0A4S3IYG8_9EURO|nr:hypothetical protein EYZ11_013124 [Aspergillus tanneri]